MLYPHLVASDVPFRVLHCPKVYIYICLHRFYLQFNTVPHLALIGFSVHLLSGAPHVIALIYPKVFSGPSLAMFNVHFKY